MPPMSFISELMTSTGTGATTSASTTSTSTTAPNTNATTTSTATRTVTMASTLAAPRPIRRARPDGLGVPAGSPLALPLKMPLPMNLHMRRLPTNAPQGTTEPDTSDFFEHLNLSGPDNKENGKLINIKELVAQNAAKERPAIVLDLPRPVTARDSGDNQNDDNGGGVSRQQLLSDMLGSRLNISADTRAPTSVAATTNRPDKLPDPTIQGAEHPGHAAFFSKRNEQHTSSNLEAAATGNTTTDNEDNNSEDSNPKRAITAMLNARRPVLTTERAPPPDLRQQALNELLAKSRPPTKQIRDEDTDDEGFILLKRNPQPNDGKQNPLSDMLARRSATILPVDRALSGHSTTDSELLVNPAAPREINDDNKSDRPQLGVSEMLRQKQAKDATSTQGEPHPLNAMLASRQQQSGSPPVVSADNGSEATSESNDASTPLRDHPKYSSYFKMLKFGHPAEVVKHRMCRDGVDPAILECDPAKPLPRELPGQGGNEDSRASDPAYQAELSRYNEKIPKYQQMLKMGLPRGAVEHKMRMEGVDVSWLDGPPQPKKTSSGPTDEEIAAHRAKYSKFFKMLEMGLPRGAVEHKMRMEGIDPAELDGPAVASKAKKPSGRPSPVPAKKPSAIRKRLHWEVKRQGFRESKRDSLWRSSRSDDGMSSMRVSEESMEYLEKVFVKAVDDKIAADKGNGNGGGGKSGQKKQIMYLIDMKKSQNIAITLARIKLSYPELKREILALNPTVLSTAQLKSLIDMWPDSQEQVTIDNFHGDESEIGAAEKFLVETRNIPRFREKLGCLVFKQDFHNRVHELRESINLVIRGVNQVCENSALRRLFIYILRLGNHLNFGSDVERASTVEGFSLGSLVKLSQTKGFVGGITFLQFVVESIDRDLPELSLFPRQINLIHKCSKVSIPSLFTEKKALEEGLKSLKHEANAVVPVGGDEDAELASSILKHFAAEVEREVEDLESLLDQLMDCKQRFLEYFEEEESSEELDVLLSYIANFTAEFEREHAKHAEKKKRKESQQRPSHQKEHKKTHKKQSHGHLKHSQPHHQNPLHGHHHLHSAQRGKASAEHFLGTADRAVAPPGEVLLKSSRNVAADSKPTSSA